MDNPKFIPINTFGIPVNAVPYQLCDMLSLRAVPHYGEYYTKTTGESSYSLIYPVNIIKTQPISKLPPILQNAIDKAKPIVTEVEYFIINYDATNYLKQKEPIKSTSRLIISA